MGSPASVRPASISFEAIGTSWQIDTDEPMDAATRAAVMARIDAFDRTYSRFRDDSLVGRIARTPGTVEFPDDAGDLFELYRRLYEATGGAVSPLVGRSLETLGYDRAYTLRASGPALPAPSWDDSFAWDGRALTTIRPVTVDVGAAGKGYLVDIVGRMLTAAGHEGFVIDASGNILRHGEGTIRVGLEHPWDASKAIGVANLGRGAICASAPNRRTWGEGLHHIVDATTGLPTRRVIATWAIADDALVADGLATALFFTDPARLQRDFDFSYVRMFADQTVEFWPHLDGEIYL